MKTCPISDKINNMGPAGPLAVIRIILGFMLLWAFFDKLFGLGLETQVGEGWLNGYSPSYGYLMSLNGWFSGFFHWLAGGYQICDIFMMAGLLCLGMTLFLGIAKKLTTLFAILLMIFFMLSVLPPKDNPILEYHLTYIVSLIAIYAGDGFSRFGLESKWKELSIVKRFPILE